MHDTTPIRASATITVADSTSATIELSQSLDPSPAARAGTGARCARSPTRRPFADRRRSCPSRWMTASTAAPAPARTRRTPTPPRRHDQARYGGRRRDAARQAPGSRWAGRPPRRATAAQAAHQSAAAHRPADAAGAPAVDARQAVRGRDPRPPQRHRRRRRRARACMTVPSPPRPTPRRARRRFPHSDRPRPAPIRSNGRRPDRRRLAQATAGEEDLVTDRRRELPSVDRLLREPGVDALLRHRAAARPWSAAIRESLAAARTRRAGPPEDWAAEIRERLAERAAPGLRPVLNATGVVLHTNLGRAPLAAAAVEAHRTPSRPGYSNLELDLDTGTRGQPHRPLPRAAPPLSPAREDALVVNNAAGALVLALNALAAGRDVADLAGRADRDRRLVPHSRHHGPERRPAAGGRDHQPHPPGRLSASPSAPATGRDPHGAPLQLRAARVRDLAGAGRAGRARAGRPAFPICTTWAAGSWPICRPGDSTSEPRVADALAAGAGLVLFSGDKLLGGPQAGCLVGRQRRWSRVPAQSARARPARGQADPGRARGHARAVRGSRDRAARDSGAAHADPGRRPSSRAAPSSGRACPAELRAELEPGESAVGGGVVSRRRAAHDARGARCRLRSAPTAWRSGSGSATRVVGAGGRRSACCWTRAPSRERGEVVGRALPGLRIARPAVSLDRDGSASGAARELSTGEARRCGNNGAGVGGSHRDSRSAGS